jgi:hypothetical protein
MRAPGPPLQSRQVREDEVRRGQGCLIRRQNAGLANALNGVEWMSIAGVLKTAPVS